MVAYVADTYLYIGMYKYIVVCRRKRTNALYTREDGFPAKAERKSGFMDEESRIERKLTLQAKKMGGMAVKFTSPGLDGVPDRIVLLPGRKIAFVELKAPGKKPRPLQEKRMRQLKSLGFPVYVIDDIEQIGGVLDEICAT